MALNRAFGLLLLAFVALDPSSADLVGLQEAAKGRTLARFTQGDPANSECWDRAGKDGYYSVVDTHNHFRPFGGPPVPFNTYLQWMREHGIVFTTMFGIGQRLFKKRESDPNCCYYLHCPNYDYMVLPDPYNDRKNAEDYARYQRSKQTKDVHLTLSYTSANLQNPDNITGWITDLERDFPDSFGWAGEINVYKHALAANGFFSHPRVTEEHVESGALDTFFQMMADKGWPVTLHCDLGCDNYDAIPDPKAEDKNKRGNVRGCELPANERRKAHLHRGWWKHFLGEPIYQSFFDAQDYPKSNFRKIMHLRVWDTILSRFPSTKIVWAHIGLSKELKHLHPVVHVHILNELMTRHSNLYADISWDVLAKGLLMNYSPTRNISRLLPKNHPDLDEHTAHFLFNASDVDAVRSGLQEIFDAKKHIANETGSGNVVTGPTYAMALYLDVFHTFSDRFLTGTDFVASTGSPEMFPGLYRYKKIPTGCVKTPESHARQVTDTSSINMFLDDEAFSKIVLGGNYFKLIGIDDVYAPPPICGAKVRQEEVVRSCVHVS